MLNQIVRMLLFFAAMACYYAKDQLGVIYFMGLCIVWTIEINKTSVTVNNYSEKV